MPCPTAKTASDVEFDINRPTANPATLVILGMTVTSVNDNPLVTRIRAGKMIAARRHPNSMNGAVWDGFKLCGPTSLGRVKRDPDDPVHRFSDCGRAAGEDRC